MSTPREILRQTAMTYEADIATAEYLMRKYGGADSRAATPARIINWVLRMDPALLDTKRHQLESLDTGYETASAANAITVLDEWKGEGAEAFCGRWDRLRSHVGTTNNTGLRGHLDALVDDMGALADRMAEFQTKCADAIEVHLAGLRERYISGLAHSGEGADEVIAESAAGGALEGAGYGEFGGAKGTAAGAVLGGAIGMIIGFLKANEEQARRLAQVRRDGASDGKVFGQDIDDLSKSLGALDPGKYGSGPDGRVEYLPIEGNEAVRKVDPGLTDEALDKGWE
ncbi:MAG: hypothetical protein ACRDT4_01675 [Micromonosporaceae bacterium]